MQIDYLFCRVRVLRIGVSCGGKKKYRPGKYSSGTGGKSRITGELCKKCIPSVVKAEEYSKLAFKVSGRWLK